MPTNNRHSTGNGALVAASWANVALLDTWQGLFDPTHLSTIGGRPSAEAYWTAALVVLLAAVVGASAAAIRGKVRDTIWIPVGDGALVVALITIVLMVWREMGGILPTLSPSLRSSTDSERLGVSLAVLLGCFLVARHWRTCMRASRRFFLLLSPFLVVTLGRATFAMSSADFAMLDRTVFSMGIADRHAGPRVIIVVFDELDYTYTFSGRPTSVHLPTFDKLRQESVFATNVISPANATVLSLPVYILGGPVDSAGRSLLRSTGSSMPGEIEMLIANSKSTLFHDAARLGAPSELVGAFLPYCRWSFATLLERCTWRPFTWGGVFDGPVGIGPSIVRQLLALFIVGNRREHIARIEELTVAGVRAVSDSSRRLVFLHLPIPHFPPVWDASQGRYVLTSFNPNAYFDNLALADAILARVCTAIDRGATAQSTFLIVTSDHPWRSGPINGQAGGGIPFIVRTPSEERIEVRNAVHSVRLRKLASQLLSGKLTTARDIAAWLAGPVQ